MTEKVDLAALQAHRRQVLGRLYDRAVAREGDDAADLLTRGTPREASSTVSISPDRREQNVRDAATLLPPPAARVIAETAGDPALFAALHFRHRQQLQREREAARVAADQPAIAPATITVAPAAAVAAPPVDVPDGRRQLAGRAAWVAPAQAAVGGLPSPRALAPRAARMMSA